MKELIIFTIGLIIIWFYLYSKLKRPNKPTSINEEVIRQEMRSGGKGPHNF